MRKLILAMLILMTCVVLFSAEPVAYLVKSKGNIQVYREQKTLKFKNGELLYNNDEIITGAESYAAIKYVDGAATMKVFPNSLIRISAVKEDKQLNKTSTIQVGSVYSRISNKIKGLYKVETPNTVASVKGTGFIARYNADKRTHVIVLEGEVLVQNKDSGKSKTVSKGSSASCAQDGEVSVADTQTGEVSDTELYEIEQLNQEVLKTIRIQITDDNGNIKYLDISY